MSFYRIFVIFDNEEMNAADCFINIYHRYGSYEQAKKAMDYLQYESQNLNFYIA